MKITNNRRSFLIKNRNELKRIKLCLTLTLNMFYCESKQKNLVREIYVGVVVLIKKPRSSIHHS
jgi:hypothetical protein